MAAADVVISSRGRDDAGGTGGGGPCGGADSVSRRHRRSPAAQRGTCWRGAGAAVVIDERDLTAERLADVTADLMQDDARRGRMATAMRGIRPARRGGAHRRSAARLGGPAGPAGGVMAWLGRTRRVHFVGIGGIGMSGIAELLANLGYEVSGSDARRSDVTDRLARLGVRIGIGHDAANVGEADVVVVSSAIAAGQSRGGRSAPAPRAGDSARGNAGRAHAPALRHRHRRRARQDDDHLDGGA